MTSDFFAGTDFLALFAISPLRSPGVGHHAGCLSPRETGRRMAVALILEQHLLRALHDHPDARLADARQLALGAPFAYIVDSKSAAPLISSY